MDITLASVLEWDAVAGAVSYNVRAFNNDTQVPVGTQQNVTVTSVPVSTYLGGQGLGNYRFEVQPVDSNGQPGAWESLIGTYVAPAGPLNLRFV